jgi:predicted O-linked N-acetylglucosamine transferase (SPINDLY family)
MAKVPSSLAPAVQLYHAGRLEEALPLAEQAVREAPSNPDAHKVLGLVNFHLSRPKLAEQHYRKALALNPGDTQVRLFLAHALSVTNRSGEAIPLLEAAADLAPDPSVILRLLADLQMNTGDYAGASRTIQRACRRTMRESDPANVRLLAEIGRVEDAVRLALTTPSDYANDPDLGAPVAFRFNSCSSVTADQASQFHFAVGRSAQVFGPVQVPAMPNDRDAQRPLRIGFVSRDIRSHSVAFFLEPLLRGLKGSPDQAYLYVNQVDADDFTERLVNLAAATRRVAGMHEIDVIKQIHADQIDILIDLGGFTANTGVWMFRSRICPIQGTFLGYPNTTGIANMDIRIVDAISDPPGSEHLASEKLVRLAPSFLCYTPPDEAPPVPARVDGPITFGSFNTLWKYSSKMYDAWANLLKAVPGSKLLLKAYPLKDPWVSAQIVEQFTSRGVEASRIECVARTESRAEHLALYARIDLALDTFPYNGTTTTCEALYMGVPVLTTRGDRHAARVSASLLNAIGHPELIAENEADFVARGAALARDRAKLDAYRANLRQTMLASRLCDANSYTQEFRRVMREVWQEWCTKN